MGNHERADLDRHLTPDEIELCALEAPEPGRPERLRAHLRGCAACRREVASLTALDRRLAALPDVGATPGFAERVMARVQLPVPWHMRAWEAIRRRWLVLTVGLAGATATVGGMAYWLFAHQGLTPGGLATFIYEGLRSLAIQGVIAVGRALYGIGAVDFVGRIVESVTLPEAASAMALVSLLGFGALLTMRKVIEASASTPRVAGG